MGLMLQPSTIHHHLIALFRLFMSQPPPADIPGLFPKLGYTVETRAWHDMLRDNASACKLLRIEFCKTRGDNLHEFLILYFSHPTHGGARAVTVIDRALKDSSQSSFVLSPSVPAQKTMEALDKVHVMGVGDRLATYLSDAYDPYDKLCVLEYGSHSGNNSSEVQPPSAIQLSTLLLVITNHQPNYDLYEYNCYWYADTVFEACKRLFPGGREACNRHGDRGRSRVNIPMLATHSLPDVCNEYHVEWKKVSQRWRAGQEIIAQQEWERRLEEERKAHEAAQQEWEEERRMAYQAAQLEMERKLEEERRAAYQAARQEWERKLEEERRSAYQVVQREWERKLEEERKSTYQAVQQEWERKLEEERRVALQITQQKLEEAERRCEQLRAELQAVRQIPLHLPSS